MPTHIPHWIEGARREGASGRTGEVTDSATGEVTGEVALASLEEVDAAVAAASAAFPGWRDTSLAKRTAVLFRFRELLNARKPELAAINTVVLKPSEQDPSAALWMAELWKEAGLPDGVFNVLQGDKVAVDRLLEHPDIQSVSFVGSTAIAQYVYETGTRHGKRVQALGGAKNHMVGLPTPTWTSPPTRR